MQVGKSEDQGLYNKCSAAVHPGALAAGTVQQYNTISLIFRSISFFLSNFSSVSSYQNILPSYPLQILRCERIYRSDISCGSLERDETLDKITAGFLGFPQSLQQTATIFHLLNYSHSQSPLICLSLATLYSTLYAL